jgi:hypothetical protein
MTERRRMNKSEGKMTRRKEKRKKKKETKRTSLIDRIIFDKRGIRTHTLFELRNPGRLDNLSRSF